MLNSSFLASLDSAARENEFSDKTEKLQMHVNNLKVSKYALKRILLPSSHRAQVVERKKNT